MKKLLIFLGALVGIAVVFKRFGPKFGQIDWEQRLAAMPDNAPPKWMFTNIAAIRENTDRILERLEQAGSPAANTLPDAT